MMETKSIRAAVSERRKKGMKATNKNRKRQKLYKKDEGKRGECGGKRPFLTTTEEKERARSTAMNPKKHTRRKTKDLYKH